LVAPIEVCCAIFAIDPRRITFSAKFGVIKVSMETHSGV
jgi:hypothetical protein